MGDEEQSSSVSTRESSTDFLKDAILASLSKFSTDVASVLDTKLNEIKDKLTPVSVASSALSHQYGGASFQLVSKILLFLKIRTVNLQGHPLAHDKSVLSK